MARRADPFGFDPATAARWLALVRAATWPLLPAARDRRRAPAQEGPGADHRLPLGNHSVRRRVHAGRDSRGDRALLALHRRQPVRARRRRRETSCGSKVRSSAARRSSRRCCAPAICCCSFRAAPVTWSGRISRSATRCCRIAASRPDTADTSRLRCGRGRRSSRWPSSVRRKPTCCWATSRWWRRSSACRSFRSSCFRGRCR